MSEASHLQEERMKSRDHQQRLTEDAEASMDLHESAENSEDVTMNGINKLYSLV